MTRKEALSKFLKRRSSKNRDNVIAFNKLLIYKIYNREFSKFYKIEEDLIQEGQIGLIRAVDLFDPSFNIEFSTYAGTAIRRGMGNFIKRKLKTVARCRVGRDYLPIPIVRALPLDIDHIVPPTSPIEPSGMIERLTEILSDQEKEILFRYVFNEESNQEIGDKLKFSREKTRQIKQRAIEALKKEINLDAA